MDLRAALDSAWQRSVAARETAGQRERALAERAATAVPWSAPPALEVGRREDRTSAGGARETDLGLVAPLWWPGQRAALAQRTEIAVGLAAAQEGVERLRLAGLLRDLVWEWAQLRTEAELAEQQLASLTALADDVDRRVGAGELARSDGMAARAAQYTAQAHQADVQGRLRAVQGRWAVLTGLAHPTRPPSSPEQLARKPEVAADHVHPELMLARLDTELAEQSLRVVQASPADAPEVSFAVRQDSTVRQGAVPHSLALGLRIPLGAQSRNRPRLAAAQAALDLARIRHERLIERLANEAATAGQAWGTAQLQFESLKRGSELLRERARLIERSFRAGETALPELLRTLAAAATAEAATARQLAAWGLARARLEQTLGTLP